MIKNYISEVKTSFFRSWRGEERLEIVLWCWGGIALAICYFIIQPIIRFNRVAAIDSVISALLIGYFTWHIIIIRKNSPKKPKLDKEEKKKLKEEKKKLFWKSLGRKLMLKESFSKWNPALIMTVIDLYAILVYVTYLY